MSEYVSVMDACEYCNEEPGSIKGGKLYGRTSDYVYKCRIRYRPCYIVRFNAKVANLRISQHITLQFTINVEFPSVITNIID